MKFTSIKEEIEYSKKRYNLKKYLPFQKDVYKNYTDKKSEEFVEKLNDLIQ